MNNYDLTKVNATDGAVTHNDNLVRFLRYDVDSVCYCFYQIVRPKISNQTEDNIIQNTANFVSSYHCISTGDLLDLAAMVGSCYSKVHVCAKDSGFFKFSAMKLGSITCNYQCNRSDNYRQHSRVLQSELSRSRSD